jgi:hypothetical protein
MMRCETSVMGEKGERCGADERATLLVTRLSPSQYAIRSLLVCLGHLVHLVSLVHLVPLCDKPDKLDKPN